MNQFQLEVADNRTTGSMVWLTLHAPELARTVRAGQYLLVRCADASSYDPLLRRPLFVAAAEEALGQVGLLFAPSERGLAWLARARPGEILDLLGPFGAPFALARTTRTLLLIGEGPGLVALLLLAAQAARRGNTVTLLAGASTPALLPPPFLLPADVEYESTVGSALDLLGLAPALSDSVPLSKSAQKKLRKLPQTAAPAQRSTSEARLEWADQLCVALPREQVSTLANAVRGAKLRWERGFASALLECPLVCGMGACGVCASQIRGSNRLLCVDGPVVDLRDV